MDLNIIGTGSLGQINLIPDRVAAIIIASKDDRCEPTPGSKQCQWCDAKAVCKAHADWVTARDLVQFEDLDALDVVPDRLPAVETLSVEQLAQIMDRAGEFSGWLEAVEKEALRLLEQGQDVPGYKLVRARTRERYKDEAKVVGWLQYHELHAALHAPSPRTPNQIRQLIKESKRLLSAFEQYVERPEGRPVVAPVSDKREAISPIQFDDITR